MKVHCLDRNNKTNKTFLFAEGSLNEESFSDNYVVSSQSIYSDDSIYTIKNKIAGVLDNISYEEIYLFMSVERKIDWFRVYNDCKPVMNYDKLCSILSNLDISFDNLPRKDEYFYDDFLKIVESKSLVKIPLGQNFSKNHDYTFCANPFATNIEYQASSKNHLVSFDNMLLLNWGKPHNNEIFVCFAEDVFSNPNPNVLYYPRLYQEGIVNTDDLDAQKQKLVQKTRQTIVKTNYDSINMYHTIYNGRTSELKYDERGIIEYSLQIQNQFTAQFPLEIIFKNIHANAHMPFIKYNPGNLRENIYRFYCEKISKNGQKIPVLQKSTIMTLSQRLGKRKQISMYIPKITNQRNGHDIYIDFESTGNMIVSGEIKTAISPEDLTTVLKRALNPVIETMNQFLQKSGYSLRPFDSLYGVDIQRLKYFVKFELENELQFPKYSKCLSAIFSNYAQIFELQSTMYYKRVENFSLMDEQMMFIKSVYDTNDDISIISRAIVDKYGLDSNAAQNMFSRFLQNMSEYDGKILENPGFPTTMQIAPLENKVTITMDHITSMEYLPSIQLYLDSFLRITQRPKSMPITIKQIESICARYEKVAEIPTVQTMVDVQAVPSEKIVLKTVSIPEISSAEFTDEKDDVDRSIIREEDEEDALFYLDDEEQFDGGAESPDKENVTYKINPTGTKLQHPNLFETRMKKAEPFMFMTKTGKKVDYSRACLSSSKRQPVVLTQDEKDIIDRDHPGSYEHALKYGTDPENQYWYICPRYWCLETNTSISEEEVKAGKCGKKPYPHNIVPENADIVPEGAYVIEFKGDKHVNKDGSYKTHYPGIMKKKSDDGFCLPCCFSEWKSDYLMKNRQGCANISDDDQDDNISSAQKKRSRRSHTTKQANYVMGIDKFPLPVGRWGFLPLSIQSFLQARNDGCVSKTNPAVLNPNETCLLRYGMEKSNKQSFISCISALYAHKQGLDTIPSLDEMKDILKKKITLDMFLQYEQASLVSIFKPLEIHVSEIDYEKYSNTEFMKTLDLDNENHEDFLQDTIASFENFIAFLMDPDSEIDHTYLWDLATKNDSNIMRGGYNVVIMELKNDDVTDNMQITCPPHGQVYDQTKETVILVKIDNLYEPIYQYHKDEDQIIRAFTQQNAPPSIKKVLNIIQKISKTQCTSLASLSYNKYPLWPESASPDVSKVYQFKKNKDLSAIIIELKTAHYEIIYQVLNYQGKIIAVVVEKDNKRVYVPCFPSAILPDLPKKFMDEDAYLWTDYETTRDELLKINQITNKNVLSKPIMKFLEDGMIVGILTETNQLVPIMPIVENINDDGLIAVDDNNYIIPDKVAALSRYPDPKRVEITKKIALESQFTTLFRSTLRTILSYYENREIRTEIIELVENKAMTYMHKLRKMENVLKDITGDKIIFAEMEDTILDNCYQNDFACFINDAGKKQITIPKYNLLSGKSNRMIYYARMADEILRYRRIQLFMLNPGSYLNIGYSDYSIYDNEVLLLQSLLNNDYFQNMVAFNDSKYLKRVDYNNAFPALTINYVDKPITGEEQRKMETDNIPELQIVNMDCVKKIRDIQGNTHSMWKRAFPKTAKEYVFHPKIQCSFHVLISILHDYLNRQGKLSVALTVQNIKSQLWKAYSDYSNNDKLVEVLKMQGKRKLFENGATLEEVIMSEGYYITDLDIWLMAKKTQLPIILFSSTTLKNLVEGVDWLLLYGKPQDRFYFIRSPANVAPGEVPEYQLVMPTIAPNSMQEFATVFETAVADSKSRFIPNVQSFDKYLTEYKYIRRRGTK